MRKTLVWILVALYAFIFALLTIDSLSADVLIRKPSLSITAMPTISTSAYAVGDALGDKITFTRAAGTRKTALLRSLLLVDKSKQNVPIDIVCFDRDFTETTDNDPIAISAADAQNIIMSIFVSEADYVDVGNASVVSLGNIERVFTIHNDVDMRCQMIVQEVATYDVTTDIRITLQFVHD